MTDKAKPFCFIIASKDEFESNVEEQYAPIDEWKHKWTPNKFVDRKGKTRDFGYVTYKVLNSSRSFPDDTFEERQSDSKERKIQTRRQILFYSSRRRRMILISKTDQAYWLTHTFQQTQKLGETLHSTMITYGVQKEAQCQEKRQRKKVWQIQELLTETS